MVKIGDFPLKGDFPEFDHAPERESRFFLITGACTFRKWSQTTTH